MGVEGAVYLAMFVLLSACAFLVPVVFVRRYHYYAVRFRGTIYYGRFRFGWPLVTVGSELVSIGGAICCIWLLGWPPLGQDQWLRLWLVIFSLGMLCNLVGLSLVQDGLTFLRMRSRRTSPEK
jgi:hypothetical protein